MEDAQCTSLMMINKVVDQNYWLKNLDTTSLESTNYESIEEFYFLKIRK